MELQFMTQQLLLGGDGLGCHSQLVRVALKKKVYKNLYSNGSGITSLQTIRY